uniref:Uncharacterized protein n=1 Tax=Anopheles merus TaxID=30066 RepID=A0A182VCP9_ANOME
MYNVRIPLCNATNCLGDGFAMATSEGAKYELYSTPCSDLSIDSRSIASHASRLNGFRETGGMSDAIIALIGGGSGTFWITFRFVMARLTLLKLLLFARYRLVMFSAEPRNLPVFFRVDGGATAGTVGGGAVVDPPAPPGLPPDCGLVEAICADCCCCDAVVCCCYCDRVN